MTIWIPFYSAQRVPSLTAVVLRGGGRSWSAHLAFTQRENVQDARQSCVEKNGVLVLYSARNATTGSTREAR
jgi:hypothetical protein